MPPFFKREEKCSFSSLQEGRVPGMYTFGRGVVMRVDKCHCDWGKLSVLPSAFYRWEILGSFHITAKA